MWNLAHGRGFYAAVYGHSYLILHFSPILALFAPLYRLWDAPLWPMVIQCAALGASGPLLAGVAGRLGVSPSATVGLVLIWFFEVLAQRVYLVEFHTVALQAPLVFAFARSTMDRRHGLAALSAGLLLATREDAFVGLVPLAMFLAWRQRAWAPAATGVVALLYGWWAVRYAPLLVGGASVFQLRASGFRLFQSPGAFLEVFRWTRFERAYLLLPHAVLAAFSRAWLVVVVAPLLQVVLSGYPAQYHLELHYSAALRPYLFLGMAAGLGALGARAARARARWLPGAALVVSAGAALAIGVHEGPLPPFPEAPAVYRRVHPRYRHLYALAARIPATASVAAPDHVFPHVSHRPTVWRYRDPASVPGSPDYYLLDAAGGFGRLSPDDFAVLVKDRGYGVEAVSGRFVLLRRGAGRVGFDDYRDLFYLVEVERTARRIGEDVVDLTASSGVARQAVNPGETAGFLSFGRAWPLGAGDFVGRVRVRNPSPGAAASGYVDAVTDRGRVELERRAFRLDPGQGWTAIELPFALDAPREVEIRLAVDRRSALAADTIAVDGPALRRAFEAAFPAGGG